jgi:probable rRNA maturation factor
MTEAKSRSPARKRRVRKPAPSISLRVEEATWRKDAAVLPLLRRAAGLALQAAAPETGGPVALTILLTGDAAVRDLNAQFRSRDEATNVLSFPASEDGAYAGDIAIAYGTVAREAKAQKKPFSAHAAHLAVHGVLHLFGHDHKRPREAETMEALEILILRKLGIDDPYRPRPYKKVRKALH